MNREHDAYFLLHADITGRILKVFFDVYHELGHGFRELVYCRALVIALNDEGLEVRKNVEWPVWFRGVRIASFIPDIVVGNGPVLIEVKAKSAIEPEDTAQILNYLRASDIEVGLVLNFGRRPEHVRRIFENRNKLRTGPTAKPIPIDPR